MSIDIIKLIIIIIRNKDKRKYEEKFHFLQGYYQSRFESRKKEGRKRKAWTTLDRKISISQLVSPVSRNVCISNFLYLPSSLSFFSTRTQIYVTHMERFILINNSIRKHTSYMIQLKLIEINQWKKFIFCFIRFN